MDIDDDEDGAEKVMKNFLSSKCKLANKMSYIEIAYDLQSGSYIEAMKNPEHEAMKRENNIVNLVVVVSVDT